MKFKSLEDLEYFIKNKKFKKIFLLTGKNSFFQSGAQEIMSFMLKYKKIHIYFKHIQTIYEFGPYGPNHATAGTFAFKRELLDQTKYDDDAEMAEEKQFLKNYTIPFQQLNARKVILVFAHDANTFDKKILLERGENDFMRKTGLKVKSFIKDKAMREFYINQ